MSRTTLQRTTRWCATVSEQHTSAFFENDHRQRKNQHVKKSSVSSNGNEGGASTEMSQWGCVHLQEFRAQHKHARTDQHGELENFVAQNSATAFHSTSPKLGLPQATPTPSNSHQVVQRQTPVSGNGPERELHIRDRSKLCEQDGLW